MNLICRRLDPEPCGIEGRKEQQDQHRADRRAADQRKSHRSPEDGVREGDEGQHGGKCGQDHGPRALHRGFEKRRFFKGPELNSEAGRKRANRQEAASPTMPNGLVKPVSAAVPLRMGSASSNG